MANQTRTKKSAPVSKSGGVGTRSKAAPKKAGSAVSSSQDSSMLQEFILDSLKDIYWAEKHLTKALPKMHMAATSSGLKAAIKDHSVQTLEHVSRLEQVFQLLGKRPQAKKCDGMEGLVKEGETAVESTRPGSMTRDVAIIMSSQKVEHYEIAGYGTLVQLATILGNSNASDILQKTLDEEKQSDQKLSAIAKESVNWEASTEQEDNPDFRGEGTGVHK